ncbi:MAG TPA: hypothetical protein VIJ22_14450 [Polyangiaceae bacterium]
MRRTLWLGLVPLSLACTSVSQEGSPPLPIVLAHPPADPGGPPPELDGSASEVSVFAIRTLYLGDTDRTGVASPNAWKAFGFDIDGKATTRQSTDVCQLQVGASNLTQEDGQDGIDNAFGISLMPLLITTFGPDFSSQVNASLSAGLMTNLIVVHGLGTATTASPLTAELVVAAPLGGMPTWSTADVWPVDSSSLRDLDAGSPLLMFPQSYVVGGVLVAEPPAGAGELALGIAGGAPLVLPIRHVQIAMTLSPDGMTATAGTISGILPTDRLVALAQNVAGTVGTTLCSGSAFLTLAQWIEQSEESLLDGTQDPSLPCDGISIGLGFEAVRVQRGPVAVVPPFGDACPAADAGP